MIRKYQLTLSLLLVLAVLVLIAAYIDLFIKNRSHVTVQPATTGQQKVAIQHPMPNAENKTAAIQTLGIQHQHSNKPRFDIPELPTELQEFLNERQQASFELEPTSSGYRLQANGQWEVVTMAIVNEDGSITLIERQVQPQQPIDLPAPSS